MHRDAADRMVTQAAEAVPACVRISKNTNSSESITVVNELCRVMENQNRLAVGDESFARGLEMASQNLFFTHTIVRKEAVSRLGVGPVLTNPWDAAADATGQQLKKFSEPLAVPRIAKSAIRKLLIDPCVAPGSRGADILLSTP